MFKMLWPSFRSTLVVVALIGAPLGANAQDAAPVPAPAKPAKVIKPKAAKTAAANLPRTASIRVLHAVPGAPAVDVYIDGTKVLTNAGFKSVSDYLTVPSGKRAVKITATGSTDALATTQITTKKAGFYTAYAFKDGDKIALDSLNESSGAVLKEGKARVYVVHLAAGAPAVDVMTASTRVKSGHATFVKKLGFNKARNKTVKSGAETLQIMSGDKVLKEVPLQIAAGQRYSAFAVGVAGATDATAFDVIAVPAGAAAPTELKPVDAPVAAAPQ